MAEGNMLRACFLPCKEHDVCWFQIAMKETALFGCAQGPSDLHSHIKSEDWIEWPFPSNTRFERFSVNELHHVKTIPFGMFFRVDLVQRGRVVDNTEVKNADHVWVPQLRR
jgi:hypothetical protein